MHVVANGELFRMKNYYGINLPTLPIKAFLVI